MVREATEILPGRRTVIKIPMTSEGLKAVKASAKGIKTNVTSYSSGQALLAARAGATYVSPFAAPDDISSDGWA